MGNLSHGFAVFDGEDCRDIFQKDGGDVVETGCPKKGGENGCAGIVEATAKAKAAERLAGKAAAEYGHIVEGGPSDGGCDISDNSEFRLVRLVGD